MDDIHVDNNSASDNPFPQRRVVKKKKNGFFTFLFDLIVRTIFLVSVLSIDFTLFANSGNYSVFTSFGTLNQEAMLIYIVIAAVSFVLVLLSLIIYPLKDVVTSLSIAGLGVALINQFATFDKNSALILFVGDWFSKDINLLLYKYCLWIVAGILFVVSFILLKKITRAVFMYLTLIVLGFGGWLVSEAYLNYNKSLFRPLISNSVSKQDNKLDAKSKNLVFLTFTDLPSINLLRNINKDKDSKTQTILDSAFGLLTNNNFVIYPNAIIEKDNDKFENIISMYNPDVESNADLSAIMPYNYFDFSLLQPSSNYLKKSSLLSLLKKQDYNINIYQMGDVNLCYLDNPKTITSCYKKISYPFVVPANQTSILNSTIVLASQWLISTGLIKDVNPLLRILKYLNIGIDTFNFNVTKVESYDAFKTLDMILHDLEYNSGNQAYFALIDLPSSTYIYDEYCAVKNVKNWVGENVSMVSPAILANKQNAYYNQLQCTYGYLNKFLKQIKNMGFDENTTVIINSANTPNQIKKVNNNDDYYKFFQNNQQTLLAIKPAKSKEYKFDYRVCNIKNILNSYFMDAPKCDDLDTIKTTKNNISLIKKMVVKDKYDNATIVNAQNKFNTWFMDWAKINNYEDSNVKQTKVKTTEIIDDKPIENQDVTDPTNNEVTENEIVKDTTDEKNTISSQEVIPDTLFDDSVDMNTQSVSDNEGNDKEKAEKIVETVTQPKEVMEEKAEEIVETVTQAKEVTEEKVEEIVETVTQPKEVMEEKAEKIIETLTRAKNTVEEKAENIIQKETNDEYNPKQGYDLQQIIKDAKEQMQINEEQEEKTTNTKEVVSEIKENISKENENIKNILVAPQTHGKKMTPEELKQQYHEMLKQAQSIKGNTISVEVVE